jgi:catechol 2,3-dioxygenase
MEAVMENHVKLGHVALPARDPAGLARFYGELLGLTSTMQGALPGLGDFIFLSGQPADVLQELTFMTRPEARHVAFEVDSLANLRAVYASAKERGVRVLMALDHRSSVSLMLVDPEGNNLEVYWLTGRRADALYAAPIDLDRPEAELMKQLQA